MSVTLFLVRILQIGHQWHIYGWVAISSTGLTIHKVISNHLLSWMKAAGSSKGGAGDEPKHHNYYYGRRAAPVESTE